LLTQKPKLCRLPVILHLPCPTAGESHSIYATTKS
jgi:hypothetical protein